MIATEIGEGGEIEVDEAAAVRRQLTRLLAHSSFRNSRRCQAFLQYVIEEKLQGNGSSLKERMIGISVFQLPLDYDTNANSVVRVTAGEVRKRLAQYYMDATPNDGPIIELPLGSYAPEFRTFEPTVLPAEVASPESPEERLPENQRQPGHALNPAPVNPTPARSFWTINVAAMLLCAALLTTTLLATTLQHRNGMSVSDRIWQGAFNKQDVLLCAGALDPMASSLPGHVPQLGFTYTTAKTAAIIGSAIGHAEGSASLVSAQDTKIEDLQRAPVVLIGAYNNDWTMRFQAPLRYQFHHSLDGSPDSIVDTKQTDAKPLPRILGSPRDYAIFAHFKSPTTGQSTVIAAGMSKQGTAAVRLFLSSPELLKEFEKTAPSGWEKGSYEIVLASDLLNNQADPPRVLTAYFW